jgi:phosphatidate cytidylyltransferase
LVLQFLLPNWQLWSVLLLAVGISTLLLIGDLLFSAIKREVGIKDFGYALSVTGGVLDKFDGLMLTIPLFFIVMQQLGG